MKVPIRTTIALDEKTAEILESMSGPSSSQSNVVRKAIRFYYLFKDLKDRDLENLKVYEEMLSGGEHVILDVDHLIAFLEIVEDLRDNEKFWDVHRTIAKNHAEQFRNMEIEQILRRLETCNFFRLVKSGDDLTLIFGNERVKKFERLFLEEIFRDLHKNVEIKDELAKLKIKVPSKSK
jgi:hypothetical protein